MNKKLIAILAIAFTICLLAVAGCTDTSSGTCPAPAAGQVILQPSPVSINATPV